MKKIIILILSIVLFTSCVIDKSKIKEAPENSDTWVIINIDWNEMKENISDSPRHQEWVEIDNNWKTIHAFVVYPENNEKSSAVIMIHENKWLTDWVRDMADQVAAEGHIVVAPDLLSSYDSEKQRTSDFVTEDDATKALYSIDPEQTRSDLDAIAKYVSTLDSYNWNLVSVGFCWGGSQAFWFANDNSSIKASLVFYWTAPKDGASYDNIKIPVYWFYAENDERVNSTIEQTEKYMNERQMTYEYEIYPWVWHAFMRNAQSDDADVISKESRSKAFERMKSILEQYK